MRKIKINQIFFLIIIFVSFIKMGYAAYAPPFNPPAPAPVPVDAASLPSVEIFIMGTKIKTLFDDHIVKLFKPIYSVIYGNSMHYVVDIFKALFMMDIAYILSKCYLEGNYNGIATTFVTKALFGSLAIAFVSNPNYFYGIPSDVATVAFGGQSAPVNFNVKTPIEIMSDVIAGLFKPWDKAVRSVLTAANDAYKEVQKTSNEGWNSLNPFAGFFESLMAIITFYSSVVIGFLGYIIILLACFGLILKGVEFCIALPIAVFFLAFKATSITNSYSETALKYIITATFELSLLLLIANLGETLITGNGSPTGVFELLGCLFPLFLYVTLIKVAPSIGSGILSGSPSVKMSDAGKFLETAMLAKAMATAMPFMVMGGGGAIMGAIKGVATGGADGGGVMGAIKGAALGGKGGMQTGAGKLGGGGGGAMSNLSKSLSNATKG